MVDLKAAEETTQTTLDTLRERLVRSEGGMQRIAKAIGVQPTTLTRWLNQERKLPLVRLHQILLVLGEEPTECVRVAPSVPDICALLGRPPWGTPPNLIREVRRAARRLPRPTSAPEIPVPEVRGLAIRLRHGSLRKRIAWLKDLRDTGEVLAAATALDTLRQAKPDEAERLTRTLVVQVTPKLEEGAIQAFCQAAGVLASIRRMRGALPEAAEILCLAILRARRANQRPTLAGLYQRAGYVLFNRVQFEEALLAADQATKHYLDLEDPVGLAKVQADRGIFLTGAGKPEAALQLLFQALQGLPLDARASRLSVLLAQGRCLAALDRHQEAADALAAAERLLYPEETYNRACLTWEKGSALAVAGDLEGATDAYHCARQLLDGLNPFTIASVTFDLMETLLHQGRCSEAQDEAARMARLLKPFSACSAVAEGAVMSFLRKAMVLNLEDVHIAREALAKARPQAGGLLPGG